jgi:hypothetical protein
MKFNIELDITPQEMRQLLGLPDIEDMQKDAMDRIQEKLFTAIDDSSNNETLFKQFLPLGVMGADQLQKFMGMMTQMSSGTSSGTSSAKKDTGKTS